MGKKPVFGVTGLFLAGVALVGCENSRPYQGSRAGGPAPAGGAVSQSPAWGSQPATAATTQPGTSPGMAARPATSPGQPSGTYDASGTARPLITTPAQAIPNTGGVASPSSANPYGTPLSTSPPRSTGASPNLSTPSSYERTSPAGSPLGTTPTTADRPGATGYQRPDEGGSHSGGGSSPAAPTSVPSSQNWPATGTSTTPTNERAIVPPSPPATTGTTENGTRYFDVRPPAGTSTVPPESESNK
jgi:hypothetical protein